MHQEIKYHGNSDKVSLRSWSKEDCLVSSFSINRDFFDRLHSEKKLKNVYGYIIIIIIIKNI